MLKAFEVPLREGRVLNKKNIMIRFILADCTLFNNNDHVSIVALNVTSLVSIFLNDLRATRTRMQPS